MSATPKPVYRLEPAGLMDRGSERVMRHSGAEVQIIQPAGCPPNGTMGMTYVQVAGSGEFIGLVCNTSLRKTGRMAVVRDQAAEAREKLLGNH